MSASKLKYFFHVFTRHLNFLFHDLPFYKLFRCFLNSYISQYLPIICFYFISDAITILQTPLISSWTVTSCLPGLYSRFLPFWFICRLLFNSTLENTAFIVLVLIKNLISSQLFMYWLNSTANLLRKKLISFVDISLWILLNNLGYWCVESVNS